MKDSRVNIVQTFTCNIRLLDDTELSHDVKKDTLGQILVEHVCKHLDLIEKDYFGLRYVDNNKQRHWLDNKKEISKQLKDIRQPFMFFFRVKFYPTDPTKVKEDITRYQVYLQLKRDILHGRLLCPFNSITDLAAHIVQAEVGDYNEEEHGITYINGIKLLPRHSEKLEEKIIEYHKTLIGYVPLEAEKRFLNLARCQDLYGVDPHPCKDQDDLPLYLGLTPQGIQIIREARRVSGFLWRKVHKISYDNKLFYIQISGDQQKKTNYAFRLNDAPSCKHLWRCTTEHMSFYGEEPAKSHPPRRSALSPQSIFRRSKYKFKGKTENDVLNDAEVNRRTKPVDFERKSALRLSVHLNCAKNSYSLPNLKALSSQEFAGTESSNCSTDDERSQNGTLNLTSTDNEEDDSALAEFETKHFPADISSSRSSMVDDVSLSSCYDITITQESRIPEINIDDATAVETSRWDSEAKQTSHWDTETKETSRWDSETKETSRWDSETKQTSRRVSETKETSRWDNETKETSRSCNNEIKETSNSCNNEIKETFSSSNNEIKETSCSCKREVKQSTCSCESEMNTSIPKNLSSIMVVALYKEPLLLLLLLVITAIPMAIFLQMANVKF